MMFYVYEHIRPDTNAVFYVGKGKGRRAQSARYRNQYWKRIVAKVNGFSVRMVAENVDEELAFLIEMERIDQLRRLGVKLCNMTSGGEGVSGWRPSEEIRRKMSEASKNRPPVCEDTRRKLSEIHKGKVVSEETRRKLSEMNTGKVQSEEARRKMSDSRKGRPMPPRSAEHCRKISEAKIGKPMPPVSEETRRKLSETMKGRYKGRVVSEETRKKISEAGKGRKRGLMSEEQKRKLSEAMKGRTLTEAHRRKISEAGKGRTPTEATRQKLSEASKGRVVSEETRRKISTRSGRKGRRNGRAIAVQFGGRAFESVTALAEYIGEKPATIAQRVRTNPQKYGYVIEVSKC